MNVSVVTLVNKPELYKTCVLDSLRDSVEFISIETLHCAKGLNEGLAKASEDIIICCHQDVSFPKGWVDFLEKQLQSLPSSWGVVGTYGIGVNGRSSGRIYNPAPFLRVGHGTTPSLAMSVDEHCIILQKSKGLYFDENNPHFHFYGGDICLECIGKKMECYIIDSYLNHLSEKGTLDESFFKAKEWFVNKWKGKTSFKKYRTTVCEIAL